MGIIDKDPTRTIVLRKKFSSQMYNRFSKLKGLIRKAVVDEDVLGLKNTPQNFKILQDLTTPGQKAFAFRTSEEKVSAFMAWLHEMIGNEVLEMVQGPGIGREPWANMYIRSAYQKGLSEAYARLKKEGVEVSEQILPISSSFYLPFHAERIGLIYSRVWSDLTGVTQVMETQISRILALGLAQGENPEKIARRLNDRISKIGITRARLIARTEIVRSHNLGALAEYEQAEKTIGKKVNVRWWTALDERVRGNPDGKYPNAIPSHWNRHDKVYTREDAEELLGDPNCFIGSTKVSSKMSSIKKLYKRYYVGPIVTVLLESGNSFVCSPNHPIVVENSEYMIDAKNLKVGDVLISCDIKDCVTFEELWELLFDKDVIETTAFITEKSFHGDGTYGRGNCFVRINGTIDTEENFDSYYIDFVKIVDFQFYDGYVYNMETESGKYVANNVVVGNCRCALLPAVGESPD
ncbi:MAG: phage minor head protein [Candidatus Heimdallarchaeaceae archaeon]